MHPMLNIAFHVARKAGNFIIKNYENKFYLKSNKKKENLFINNIGKKVKNLMIDIIHKYYPKHNILCKEFISDKKEEININTDDVQWIIDPFDSTLNFIKFFPHFSVSIAVLVKRKTEIAVVYDPIRNELFSATRGQGAQLNGYRLRCNMFNNINTTILVTGLFSNYHVDYINLLVKILKKYSDFRYTGSKSLDLSYVAAGRVDCFFDININKNNFICGNLLVSEAGGIFNYCCVNDNIPLNYVVAGNNRIVQNMHSLMQDYLKKNN